MDNKKEINLGRFTFDAKDVVKDVNKLLGFGVSQIYSEREKQINKHGFDAENQAKNPQYYDLITGAGIYKQLQDAAIKLLSIDKHGMSSLNTHAPENWDTEWFETLCKKPQEDRIRIAAALLAAELDRLEYLRNN